MANDDQHSVRSQGKSNYNGGKTTHSSSACFWPERGSAPHDAGTPSMVCCPYLASGGFFSQKKSWRKRHPVLFGGAVLFVGMLVLGWISQSATALKNKKKPKLGVVEVEGTILQSTSIIDWLESLTADQSVRGILVRVNSPGGAVAPSQEIYQAVKRANAVKPVIVSMGSVAASGGYYLSLGAREIYASPSSLTASIGVIMEIQNIEGLMKTLGISSKTIASGDLKGAGSAMKTMTPEEEAYFKGLIFDMYDEFIQAVASQRNLPVDKVRKYADGRAMTGRQALQAQLIDGLADMHSVKRRLRVLCDLSPDQTVELLTGPKKPRQWLEDLLKSLIHAQWQHPVNQDQPQFFYR